MNLSFSGCGFLGLYHLGVASCFKTYAPHIFLNKVDNWFENTKQKGLNPQVSGGSAGAITAASSLVEDINLGDTILINCKFDVFV